MLYRYSAIDQATGEERAGTIEAATVDIAISALQRRSLVIVSITASDETPFWEKAFSIRQKVKHRDVVILSRQIATLFGAQVSALRVFQMLSQEAEAEVLRKRLSECADDIQGGMSLSNALAKHPEVFSDFYVNMVRAGEESGNLSKTFEYLADYLDRSYELISKAKNALVYPAFVIAVFFAVMILMLVIVIPKLSAILTETGQALPFFTRVVISLSEFLLDYGLLLAALIATGGFFGWSYMRSDEGKAFLSKVSLGVPVFGNLYRKLYLARVADNLSTMLSSGIAAVRAVEISSSVVGNERYRTALLEVSQDVRTGVSLSAALARHGDVIPNIFSQMVKVGEETGEVGNILNTLAAFYKREVNNAVDTIIGLIEPAMIILLGLGVGSLLVAVLMPLYNISSAF